MSRQFLLPARSTLVAITLLLFTWLHSVSAHAQIVYPAWRGNTLRDEMQWEFPCAGQALTTNRTKWPVDGGALSVIPGWNSGHPTSFFYVNIGFGTDPKVIDNVVKTVFQITAPSRDPFPGQFCFADLSLPANDSIQVGNNATIQVIQIAMNGASLYNCADITFVERGQEDPMPEGMCTNSSTISFNSVFATTSDGLHTAGTRTGIISLLFALSVLAQWILI